MDLFLTDACRRGFFPFFLNWDFFIIVVTFTALNLLSTASIGLAPGLFSPRLSFSRPLLDGDYDDGARAARW